MKIPIIKLPLSFCKTMSSRGKKSNSSPAKASPKKVVATAAAVKKARKPNAFNDEVRSLSKEWEKLFRLTKKYKDIPTEGLKIKDDGQTVTFTRSQIDDMAKDFKARLKGLSKLRKTKRNHPAGSEAPFNKVYEIGPELRGFFEDAKIRKYFKVGDKDLVDQTGILDGPYNVHGLRALFTAYARNRGLEKLATVNKDKADADISYSFVGADDDMKKHLAKIFTKVAAARDASIKEGTATNAFDPNNFSLTTSITTIAKCGSAGDAKLNKDDADGLLKDSKDAGELVKALAKKKEKPNKAGKGGKGKAKKQ